MSFPNLTNKFSINNTYKQPLFKSDSFDKVNSESNNTTNTANYDKFESSNKKNESVDNDKKKKAKQKQDAALIAIEMMALQNPIWWNLYAAASCSNQGKH